MSTFGTKNETCPSEQEQPWIEAEGLIDSGDRSQAINVENGECELPDTGDLFNEPDRYEEFEFEFPNDIRIVIIGVKAENGQILSSTGLTLWRASPLLCNFMIATQKSIQGKIVLELGAGLGLCGLLAHFLNAKNVVLTDGDTDALAAMRANVASNVKRRNDNATISCRQLLWGHNVESFLSDYPRGFDVILASDVIYVEAVIEPLFDTVMLLMVPDGVRGEFWLSFVRRNVNIDLVLECAQRHGLEWKEPSGSEGVFVFSRQARASLKKAPE